MVSNVLQSQVESVHSPQPALPAQGDAAEPCPCIAYSILTNYQKAVEHMTWLTSYLVCTVLLDLLDTAMLRQLGFFFGPVLTSLVGHPFLPKPFWYYHIGC